MQEIIHLRAALFQRFIDKALTQLTKKYYPLQIEKFKKWEFANLIR